MNIFFCFPNRGVGGVSVLFLRLGEYLADQGHTVTLIDYADGYMARNLHGSKAQLLIYTDAGPVEIPPDATLVLQAMNPWSLFPGLKINPSVHLVFWHCMPFNLVPVLPGIRERSYRSHTLLDVTLGTVLARRRAMNRDLVRTMHAKDSLFFMDEENLSTAQRFLGLSIERPVFVPIPTLPSEGSSTVGQTRSRDGCIRLVWVGRIADFKYPILNRVLSDLDAVASGRSCAISVTIVGSGPYKSAVAEHASTLKSIDTNFVAEVASSALPDFLRAECDIAVCMGTAALDAARLGIPTILLDASYGPVRPDYRYRWLFEEQGFTLGRILFSETTYPSGRGLGDLIDEFSNEGGKLRDQTLAYIDANHSLPAVGAQLLNRLANARYLWSDFVASGANRADLIYRIFVVIRRFFRRVQA